MSLNSAGRIWPVGQRLLIPGIEGRTSNCMKVFTMVALGAGDLLLRAQTKSFEVKSSVNRGKIGRCKRCMMCEKGVDETVEHLMLECGRYE